MTTTTTPLTERAPLGVAQVGNGRTGHYVRIDGFHLKTLCGRVNDRVLTGRDADKLTKRCVRCTALAEELVTELAAAKATETPAAEETPVVEAPAAAEETPACAPAVHRFDSTEEAYDATQCRDDIHDGDVLVIESERVVGFLRSAWPAAITTEHGELHTLTAPAHEIDGGKYATSAAHAEQLATELGFTVNELHAAPAVDVTAPVFAPFKSAPVEEPKRYIVEVETRLAYPGHREDRFTVSPVGHADPVLYVALPHVAERSAATVLGALGWELVDGLEYIAGPNLERGRVAPCEPTGTPEAAELRAAVLRATTARAAALADHVGARHFRAVMPADGGPFPIGWTYATTGYSESARFGWVTAQGRGMNRVGVPSREDAEQIVRDWHAAGTDAPTETGLVDIMADLPATELHKCAVVLRGEDEPMPAETPRCVHGFNELPGDLTAPAAACAAKASVVSVGVFSDEGCVDAADCAVEASLIADRLNNEDEDAREAAAAGEPLYRWAVLCADHTEQPAIGCEECATDEDAEDVEDDADELEDAEEDEQAPAMPATYAEGDRVLCVDGLVRTASYVEVKDGKAWIFMTDRSAWPRTSSERIDTSGVPAARAAAERAAAALHASAPAPDPAALAELGDALRYLRQAAPAVHAELVDGAERMPVRIPRADVAPGDILHDQGRHDVLDVCTVEHDGEDARWWAKILGATPEVRAYTGRKPWETARRLDLARTDEVTVERPLPGVAPMPAPFTAGDTVVCADGVARTVRGMAPVVGDEPARVVVEDGTEWVAENCLRANRDDIQQARAASSNAADRVRNLDPSTPEWKTALSELGAALDLLKAADPVTRAALVEEEAHGAARAIHADAHEFQPVARPGGEVVGWSFRTGYGARARYGVVTVAAQIAPVGLFEYRTTAERAFLYAPTGDVTV